MDTKDRKTGLILFGILWILIGLACGGTALLVAVGAAAGSGTPGAPPLRIMLPAGLLYLAIGACFVTLGIGSMMARRWARALILALSWMWLITGVLSVFTLFFVLPKMFDTLPPDQSAAKPFIIGCTAVFFALFFILLPGLAILFYRSPNVKGTVEAFDPAPSWTDLPLPLLTFAIWMMFGAASLLFCAFMYPSFPVGPWLLHGLPMYALLAFFFVVTLFIALGALKRNAAAWWTAVAMVAVGAVWLVALMPKTDLVTWYRDSGLANDPRQVEMMQSLYTGPFFMIWIGVFWLGYLGFLLYLRRYFVPGEGRIGPALASLLLLLAAPALRAQSTPPCNDQKTIVVTGSGAARAFPDRVTFTVGVVTTSKSVSDAFRANNEKTNRIVRTLKEHGVRDVEIQTSNFTIDSPWDADTRMKSTNLYTVMNNVTITREDPKAVSDLIQMAIDAGANSASNLFFFNSNPTQARNVAIELAIRDARAQAEKIAAGVGRTVGAALAISTTVVPSTPGWMNNTMRESITVTAAAPAIESGTNEVSYTVIITYELK